MNYYSLVNISTKIENMTDDLKELYVDTFLYEKSSLIVLTSNDLFKYDLFKLEEGKYHIAAGDIYFVVCDVKTYDDLFKFIICHKRDKAVLKEAIREGTKIGLYASEKRLLKEVRKASYRKYEHILEYGITEEAILKYIFKNENKKIYLIKWIVENKKDWRTKKYVVPNYKRLLEIGREALEDLQAEREEERNREALTESFSEYSDYDIYYNDW